MPITLSELTIEPDFKTVVVTVSGMTFYSTRNGSSAITFPQTISTRTTYYGAAFGNVTVSIRENGVEIATPTETARTIALALNTPFMLRPDPPSAWAGAELDSINLTAHGAVGDGVTDDSTVINNAILSLSAAGGGTLELGPHTYAITSTINRKDNVTVVGVGAESALHTAQSGTILKWTGSAGGTMVKAYGTAAGAADRFGVGGGLDGITLDGNSLAAVGYDMRSWRYSRDGWVGIKGCTSAAHILSTLASTGGGDTLSAQQNWFERLDIDATGTCDGIVWDGQSDSNASLNTYALVSMKFVNGHAFHAKNSDNNVVWVARVYRNSGTGNAIYCRGHASSVAQIARSNKWFNFSASGTSQPPLVSEGTGGGITFGAMDNYVLTDQENNTALPTVSGTPPTTHPAWIHDSDFGCLGPGRSAAQLVVANDRDAAAAQAAANAGTAYSLIAYSTNGGNIKLDNGTQTGRIYVDSNGTHLSRVSGGTYSSLEDALRVNGSTSMGFFGHALGNKPTGWTAATGTATRTTFATSTVTTAVLAEHVKALIDDLLALGLLNA